MRGRQNTLCTWKHRLIVRILIVAVAVCGRNIAGADVYRADAVTADGLGVVPLPCLVKTRGSLFEVSEIVCTPVLLLGYKLEYLWDASDKLVHTRFAGAYMRNALIKELEERSLGILLVWLLLCCEFKNELLKL